MTDRRLRVSLVGASIMREAELPGYEDVTDFASECYNLAIASLKTAVLQDAALAERVEVTLLDFPVSWDRKEIGVREAEAVVASRPDVVGLSCYSWSLDTLFALGARVRAALPDAFILIGGPSAGAVGADLLAEHGWIDASARGEGEQTFTALLWQLVRAPREALRATALDTVPGLTWRPGGNGADGPAIVDNDYPERPVDVATLPSPYRAGVMKPPGSSLFVETSRGCRFRCRFCSWMGAGRKLRYVPLEAVEWDLRWALANGYTSLKFADTAINFHTERVRDLMDVIRRADPERRMRYTYFLKLELLDEEQARYLRGIPTEEIILGVESLGDAPRRAVGKPPFDADEFARKAELLRAVGPVTVSLMFGLPGDSLDGILRTIDWFVEFDRRHPDLIYLTYMFWLAVLPGASFHHDREKHRFRVMEEGTPYFLESRDFSPDDLLVMARKSVERHYAHPKFRVEFFHKEYLLQDAPAPDRHVVLPRRPDDDRPVVALAGAVDPTLERREGVRPYCLETAWMKTRAEEDDGLRRAFRLELLDLAPPNTPAALAAATDALTALNPRAIVWTPAHGDAADAAPLFAALRESLPDTLLLLSAGYGAPAPLRAALPQADVVLTGEREPALLAALHALRSGEQPSDAQAPALDDLDEIPSPLQWGFVQRPGENILLRMGRAPAEDGSAPRRTFGPQRIYGDIRWVIEQRHRHVVWTDDTLPGDPARLEELVAAIREADPDRRVVHSYQLGAPALTLACLAALEPLPAREIRLPAALPQGIDAKALREPLARLLKRSGGTLVRTGPDPRFAPRRLLARLAPWTPGMEIGGWRLEGVKAPPAPAQGALLSASWHGGGRVELLLHPPSSDRRPLPGTRHHAASVAGRHGAPPPPDDAIGRLFVLLGKALGRRGSTGSRR